MKRLVLIFLLLGLFSCQKQEKPTVAFYYWKTDFKLSENELSVLTNNQISKIYLRYFDVALSQKTGKPIPLAMVRFSQNAKEFKIVPVIYIKNEVMLDAKIDLDELVENIKGTINQINSKHSIVADEIQIDCDWTLTSRENYMKFIELFKKSIQPIKLSTTIRLHQVKYHDKTGVPKVDKGVLMYYNMGKIEVDSLNSIYDKQIASNYIKSLEHYPLPMDVALPIFSNGIHIRSNRVIGLKSKLSKQELEKDTNFVNISNNFYKALNSNYKRGVYYKKGDFIKIENITGEQLLEMADDLSQALKQQPKEIIFYDLDERNLNHYDKEIFEKIRSRF